MAAPTCLKCGKPVTDQVTKPSAVYAVHIECVLDDLGYPGGDD